jgi:hypothetical protein
VCTNKVRREQTFIPKNLSPFLKGLTADICSEDVFVALFGRPYAARAAATSIPTSPPPCRDDLLVNIHTCIYHVCLVQMCTMSTYMYVLCLYCVNVFHVYMYCVYYLYITYVHVYIHAQDKTYTDRQQLH